MLTCLWIDARKRWKHNILHFVLSVKINTFLNVTFQHPRTHYIQWHLKFAKILVRDEVSCYCLLASIHKHLNIRRLVGIAFIAWREMALRWMIKLMAVKLSSNKLPWVATAWYGSTRILRLGLCLARDVVRSGLSSLMSNSWRNASPCSSASFVVSTGTFLCTKLFIQFRKRERHRLQDIYLVYLLLWENCKLLTPGYAAVYSWSLWFE
jgi:hypothetical protein